MTLKEAEMAGENFSVVRNNHPGKRAMDQETVGCVAYLTWGQNVALGPGLLSKLLAYGNELGEGKWLSRIQKKSYR